MHKKVGWFMTCLPQKMLPPAYQTFLSSALARPSFVLLQILVSLLQQHQKLTIGGLAAHLEYPITLESRRKKLQRFFASPAISLGRLWLPLAALWLAQIFKPGETVYVVIDRTDWKMNNLLVVSVVFGKYALPLYYKSLPRLGNSHLNYQKQVLRMVKGVVEPYQVVVLGDREFCSVKLAKWLQEQGFGYCLRLRKNICIEQEGELVQLKNLGLSPGMELFYDKVQVTRIKGYGKHNVVGSWEENPGGKKAWQGWYLLTSLGFKDAVSAYKMRWGIEVMFKNSKSGGYHMEGTTASRKRFDAMIIMMFIAYTSAVLTGVRIEQYKVEKYVSRRQEPKRKEARTSVFKMGLYSESWAAISREELIEELLYLNRGKVKYHRLGLEAMMLIQRAS